MELKNSRILVTGASGSLGKQLVYELHQRGFKPVCHVRKTSDTTFVDTLGLEKRVADLRIRPEVLALTREVDVVIHTAAYVNFRKDRLTQFTGANTIGAVEMYRSARRAGVKRFLHVSTVAAVGARERTRDQKAIHQSGWIRSSNGTIDESWQFNLDHLKIPYIMTKRAAEVELAKEAAEGGPELVTVNPSIIVAPSRSGDDRSRAMKLFGHWFMPSFANMVNLVDIRDVATGVLKAVERGRPGERYLLTGDNISVRDLVLAISAILRKAPQLIGLRRWALMLA
ncbi:NAD-dependent epimerase/dehydratase family protein, partial [candidate division GN15 bacterium]|nr:NAD-dependent epimerase/dehydratase family protein [candidate division GN15 bacterium]